MLRRASRSHLVWLRACVIGVLFVFAYYRLPNNNSASYLSRLNTCAGGDNVVISIKTGATEAASKIPTLMQTSLKCAKNVLIFSDLQEDIGPYHLYDALDSVSPVLLEMNNDFHFYRKLQSRNRNMTELRQMKSLKGDNDLAAWTLDKYKFIHVLEKTWALKPGKDWYVLIDADTYMVWSNLLRWLKTLDPAKKAYFGSEVAIEGTRFAHGGSGIVLSKAVMQELIGGVAARWDDKIETECCGDLMLGMALEKEFGVGLQDAWPVMSGERPSTIPFGPGTPEYWCQPALSFHHLTPRDMMGFAEFENGRSNLSEPLTHAELFHKFVLPSLPSEKQNWDNVASDPGEFMKTGGVSSHAASFEECTKKCEADEKCFQYTHHGHTCHIGMSVRLGYTRPADEEGIWRSGWHKTRLAEWSSRQPICDEVVYPQQKV